MPPMTAEQTADLALKAGRDMRRVARVRALLDGRRHIPAVEIAAALDGRPNAEEPNADD